jgi:hypothetical protein
MATFRLVGSTPTTDLALVFLKLRRGYILKKTCTKCGVEKPIEEFPKRKISKDGYRNRCILCTKEYNKKYNKENKEEIRKKEKIRNTNPKRIAWRSAYNEKNREAKKEYNKKYHKENKESRAKYRKAYNEKNREAKKEYNKKYHKENKESIAVQRKKYYEENIEEIRKRDRHRYQTNINHRIHSNITGQIRRSVTVDRYTFGKWREILGYTWEELKEHLESQFKDGMTWENYDEWHIDHIVPKSWFNIEDVHDSALKECWALENLQPLWAYENISKNNRYSGPYDPDK